MITWENYEEYIMMYADGELTPAEEQALMAFAAANPEVRKELDAYGKVKLAPDTTQVFANKDALLKEEKRVIAFLPWVKYSIAAGIAAILFISLFRYTGKEEVMVAANSKDTVKSNISAPKNKPQLAAVAEEQKEQSMPQQTTATKAPVVVKVKKEEALATVATHKAANNKAILPVVKNAAQQVVPAANTNDISALPIAGAQKIHIQKEQPSAIEETEVPQYVAAQTEQTTKRTFWDKLPIKESGKQELQAIASAISGTYDQVNDAKSTVENTKLIVRVEKRKLMISF